MPASGLAWGAGAFVLLPEGALVGQVTVTAAVIAAMRQDCEIYAAPHTLRWCHLAQPFLDHSPSFFARIHRQRAGPALPA